MLSRLGCLSFFGGDSVGGSLLGPRRLKLSWLMRSSICCCLYCEFSYTCVCLRSPTPEHFVYRSFSQLFFREGYALFNISSISEEISDYNITEQHLENSQLSSAWNSCFISDISQLRFTALVCGVFLCYFHYNCFTGVAKLKTALDVQGERWASGRRGRVRRSEPLLEFLEYPCDCEQCSEGWGVWVTCARMSCSVVCRTSVRSAMPASHVSLVWFRVCVTSDEKQICKQLRDLWI